MSRLIIPVILIGIALAGFFMFTKPFLGEITLIKEEISTYDAALDNAKALENKRDELVNKSNAILPEDLEKVKVLMPENVDNIRLILEIEKIAQPFGMTLKDVKYDTFKKDDPATKGTVQSAGATPLASNAGYGTWHLEFSTSANYNTFLNFLKDLEKNLRIVDVASIGFSSNSTSSAGASPSLSDSYNYNFKINTYWLLN
jgi:hypothetical protein